MAILILLLLLLYPQGYFVLDETQYSINEPHHPKGTISYIINLGRARGRYHYAEPQIKLLGYDVVRISAVDGAALSENEIHQKTNFEAYKTFLGHYPKRGMIGCNLSHFKAWEAFLKRELWINKSHRIKSYRGFRGFELILNNGRHYMNKVVIR